MKSKYDRTPKNTHHGDRPLNIQSTEFIESTHTFKMKAIKIACLALLCGTFYISSSFTDDVSDASAPAPAKEEKNSNHSRRYNPGIIISTVPTDTIIEILGHTFNGLSEIRMAVEAELRIAETHFGNTVWHPTPQKPVEGLHVVCLYEPYPIFDSYDDASENRNYVNFFFSTEPFSDSYMYFLARLKHEMNYQIVNEGMSTYAAPAIYYDGDGKKMTVAQKRW